MSGRSARARQSCTGGYARRSKSVVRTAWSRSCYPVRNFVDTARAVATLRTVPQTWAPTG